MRSIELGYRIGCKTSGSPHTWSEGVGTIDAAVFGLLGLALAFTYSGASARDATRSDRAGGERDRHGVLAR